MDEMRRKDRQLLQEDAMAILMKGEYGILSTSGEDGSPYGVPVSYAVGNGKIYIHGTVALGRRLTTSKAIPKSASRWWAKRRCFQ